MYRFDVSTDIETAEASRSSAVVGQMACQLSQNKAVGEARMPSEPTRPTSIGSKPIVRRRASPVRKPEDKPCTFMLNMTENYMCALAPACEIASTVACKL